MEDSEGEVRATFSLLPYVHEVISQIESGSDDKALTSTAVETLVTRLALCRARLQELPGVNETSQSLQDTYQQQLKIYESKRALCESLGLLNEEAQTPKIDKV